MTESQFIEQNKESWEKLERLLKLPVKDADKLNDLFVKVSGDLSYARTFFPNRSVRLYLNNLTQQVFDTMRIKQKKTGWGQIVFFFKEILPFEIYQSRYALIVSLLVFTCSMGIGVFSCLHNPEFPTLILGEDYISMTEENIANGDPMAVYKDSESMAMFLGISTNNIRVAFLAFVLGLIGSIGTILVLISNGVMVGAFQFFFYQKGLFLTSFLTIWIHGTIEILSIIIAGGAGIVLGNGLLFPNTYNRTTSLRISGQRAMRIIVGLIPLFILAALLESYVTRLTEMPEILKWMIIIVSGVLMLSYFVLLPYYKHITGAFEHHSELNIVPVKEERIEADRFVFRNLSQVFSISLAYFRVHIGRILQRVVSPIMFMSALLLWYVLSLEQMDQFTQSFDSNYLALDKSGVLFMILLCATLSFALLMFYRMIQTNLQQHKEALLVFIKKYGIFFLMTGLVYFVPLYLVQGFAKVLYIILVPPHIIFNLFNDRLDNAHFGYADIMNSVKFSYNNWASFIVIHLFGLFLFYVIFFLLQTAVFGLITEFIRWHQIFDSSLLNAAFIENLSYMLAISLILPLMIFLCYFQQASLQCKNDVRDLKLKFENFGTKSKIFE